MSRGVGIDVVSIPRIERFISKFGDKALSKFLHPEEILLAKTPKTVAGFWACKEAISKSLGCGIGKELSFFDMTIYKTAKGAPKVKLSKKAQDLHTVSNIEISITHDGDIAIAVALAQ